MRAPRQTTKETVAGSLLLAHPKLSVRPNLSSLSAVLVFSFIPGTPTYRCRGSLSSVTTP